MFVGRFAVVRRVSACFNSVSRNVRRSVSNSIQPTNQAQLTRLSTTIEPVKTNRMTSHGLTESQLAEHTYTLDTPVLKLDAKTAFEALTNLEKQYAHHLSKACWTGSLIVLFQTSSESPLIFVLLRKLFSSESMADLKKLAQESADFTEDDWRALLVYAAAFLSNKGNYREFGDSKFVPVTPKHKLEALVFASEAYKNDPKTVEFLWNSVKEKMFSLNDGELTLGFHPNGVNTYFTKGCTAEDAAQVKLFMESQKIDAYNSRVFKHDNFYEIRFASVRSNDDPEERDFLDAGKDNDKFKLTRGDYSTLLKIVNQHLEEARKYSSNELEQQMIGDYVRHFRSGSLDAHKDGSRKWTKDKGPVIETYIGFIETYRDPAGMRGEFEGFVAMVNKETSKKFSYLVNNATRFLPLLPWPSEFEKDKFLQPDFTSLEVVTFAGSGIPIGINIPNYEEIKQNEGFKNVSLGNVIAASLKELKPNFLSQEDAEILEKYAGPALEVQVGLHELLGHGSGKLLKVDENGTPNFDKEKARNPLTGQPIGQWYGPGESYDSKFLSMSSSYEECRAESVGLFLSLDLDVLKVFGHEGEEAKKVIYANWLSMVRAGIESLKMYHPATSRWGQAHSQARYVITRVLLEHAAQLVKIEQKINETDQKPDLLITLADDLELINSVGRAAISDFLLKLQVFKSTGDFESAQNMYNRYSEVADDLEYPYLKFREVVMARKKPRKLFVEAATRSSVDNKTVELVSFEGSHEGLIQAFLEHVDVNGLDELVIDLWKKDAESFVF